MKNKEFDALIKKQLESFESNQTTPDWNKMQTIIEQEKSNQVFDKLVKQTLIHAEAYSPYASWDHFERKREIYQARRRHIVTTRLVECCILFMLIWTVNSFFTPEFQRQTNKSIIVAQKSARSNVHTNQNNSIGEHRIKDSELKTTDLKLKNESSLGNYFSTMKNKVNKAGKQIKEKLFTDNGSRLNMNAVIVEGQSAGDIKHSGTLQAEQVDIAEEISVSKEWANNGLISINNTSLVSPTIEKIPSLLPEYLSYNGIENIENRKIHNPVITLSNTGWHLDYYIGSTAINIHRPSSETNIGEDIYQWANSPTTALYIMKQHDAWDIGTGIEYKSIGYSPGKSEKIGDFTSGYYQQYLKSMNFNVVNIPILIYREIMQNKNFSLHAKFGTGLSMNLQSKYKQEESSGIPTLFQGQSSLSAKIADKGILNGGNFGNNSYLSIDFGIRAEYKLNQKFKAFAEVNSDLMLNALGFGPYKDQYKGIGMNVGLKTKI